MIYSSKYDSLSSVETTMIRKLKSKIRREKDDIMDIIVRNEIFIATFDCIVDLC